MPNTLESLTSEPPTLLALRKEELGAVILATLLQVQPNTRHHGNFMNMLERNYLVNLPDQTRTDCSRAFAAAWAWLETEGLIAQEPNRDPGWIFVTREGVELSKGAGINAYLKAKLLPKSQIHRRILQKVDASFLRGEYDVAVFQAFKEVEIAVREASGLPLNLIGTNLMRKAFGPTGPLRNAGGQDAEEQAVSDLFAGAIGYCKNPGSHRNVAMGAGEAVELIMFASFLIRTTEARGQQI